ncbi:hypothetical protein C8R45DRAFT_1004438 [Mycena sanguinolenta]|nr:hypothetical protein C8R45DRAFT_1004438 [Mycena sanguinolenta]
MARVLKDSPSAELRPRLPPELLMLILEHVPPDFETLRQTCLVSKQCLSISQPYLFHHICLSAPEATTGHARSSCSVLYQVLLNSPYIALYIRHVTILSASSLPRAAIPLHRRWISSDETLPALLDILVNSKVQSFRIRLSGEPWYELPLAVQSSIRSLVKSPSLRGVDFSGFDIVDTTIFKQCRIQRLKFSEMGEIRVKTESDAAETSAAFSSLTLLDMDIPAVVSWAISSPSFRALRDLRLAFHPLTDVPHVKNLLRHIGGTLESLHFQPVYSRWSPDNFFGLSDLPALTSLRLSLGISMQSDPIPWVIFILRYLGHNRLQSLTMDFRIDNRDVVHTLSWAELNSALCGPPLANLEALVITLFLYQPRPAGMRYLRNQDEETIRWLAGEIPRLLPAAAARDVFQVYELGWFFWFFAFNF